MHTVQQNRRFAETRRLSSKCTRDSEIPNFCTEGKLSFSVSDSLEKIKESEENFWYFFPNFLKFQINQTSSVQKNAKSSGISFCQGSHLQKFNTMLKKEPMEIGSQKNSLKTDRKSGTSGIKGSKFGRDDQRNAEDEAEEHDEEQRPCPFGSLAEFTPDKDAPDRGNESRALPESVGNGG